MKTHALISGLTLASAIALSGCGITDTVKDTVGGWFGAGGDISLKAELQPVASPRTVSRLWSEDIGSGMDEQRVNLRPAIDDGVLYIAERKGDVEALSADAGADRWSVDTDILISAGPGVGAGLAVVAGSDGELIALNSADGSQRWKIQASSEVLSTPIISHGLVIVRSVDGRVTAYDVDNGERRWVQTRGVPTLSLRGTGTPLIVEDRLFAGFANGKLVSLQVDEGHSVWETTVTAPRGRSELQRMVDIDNDPVAARGAVFVSAYQGDVAAIDMIEGKVYWRRDISSHQGVSTDGDRVYVTDEESKLWALNIRNGSAMWMQEELHWRGLTRPVLHGGLILVGDMEGYLHWLDPENGRVVARVRVDDAPMITAPLVVDDVAYAYNSSGELAAYRLP